MSRVLGLITARGGSKRLPGKNIKDFLGKPLLAWSIETGQASGVFDRFVLSTDSEEIAEVGKRYGIEVPFLRPKEFASDTSSSLDAVRHAYEWLRESGFDADHIILLEPPAPGRQPFHIQEAAKIIERDDIDSLLAVAELPSQFHPEKVVQKKGDLVIRYHEGKAIRESAKRSQEYSTLYFPNASLYAFKSVNFYQDPPSLWGERVFGYVMDRKYSFDIDTPEDWDAAKLHMRALLEGHA